MNEQMVSDKAQEINSRTKVQKVGQYSWKLRDKPGALQAVHKNALQVDHSYQRDGLTKKTLELARDWSWLACGALTVARRIDGEGREIGLFVVDGQHRHAAALKRADITHLPCLVFETETVVAEAAGFLAANGNRKPIPMAAKFRALCQTGDAAALLVLKLVEETGCNVHSSPGNRSVRCISLLLHLARTKADILVRMWPLLIELSGEGPVLERVVDAIVYLESNMPEGQSLLDKTWKARVLRLGVAGITEAANKAQSFYAHGGAKVWARGVAQALNKGLRTNLLMREPETEE